MRELTPFETIEINGGDVSNCRIAAAQAAGAVQELGSCNSHAASVCEDNPGSQACADAIQACQNVLEQASNAVSAAKAICNS